jgi:hypothetical protein
MMIAMIPIMSSWFSQMMPAMQGDPHKFDNDPQAMFQMMVPMMQSMMTMTVVLAAFFIATTQRQWSGAFTTAIDPVGGLRLIMRSRSCRRWFPQ